MMVVFILLLLVAYLLGSVPLAYLIAKWSRGIDIRQYGSGNVGASNVLAVVSKKWAVPVILFDTAKGMVMVWAAQGVGLNPAQQVSIGLAAIIGHNWSVFLRFGGGRGILATLGVIFALSPILGLVVLALSFSLAPFRQLSLGTSISLILLPVFSWFFSRPLGIEERLTITVGYLVIVFIAFFRRFTAPRTTLSADVTTKELLVNRLFFDRDIRDRKAWLSRTPTETDLEESLLGQEEKPGK